MKEIAITTPEEILSRYELEESTKQHIISMLGEAFSKLQEWKNIASSIVVSSVEDTEAMEQAKETRLFLMKQRTGADKVRKSLKADALQYGNAVQAIYNKIDEEIRPLEAYLLEQEKYAEVQEKLRMEALHAERVEVLRETSLIEIASELDPNKDYGVLTEAQWNAEVTKYKAVQEVRIKEAQEQIEKELAEEQERQRIAKENEELRKKAEEQAKELEAQRAKEAKLRAEQEAKEAKLRAEQEAELAKVREEQARMEQLRKQAEEEAQKAKEAQIRAEQEAKEAKLRAEQEAELARQQVATDNVAKSGDDSMDQGKRIVATIKSLIAEKPADGKYTDRVIRLQESLKNLLLNFK